MFIYILIILAIIISILFIQKKNEITEGFGPSFYGSTSRTAAARAALAARRQALVEQLQVDLKKLKKLWKNHQQYHEQLRDTSLEEDKIKRARKSLQKTQDEMSELLDGLELHPKQIDQMSGVLSCFCLRKWPKPDL